MPTYDFVCLNCNKRFNVFLSYSEYESAAIHCSHCGSDQVRRKIGRIRVARSDDSRLENFPDTDMSAMEKDPQSLGRMMRKMSEEVGEPMPGEFNEVVSRLERGQTPEQIEKAMPDLGADMPAGDDF